ncbi:MAG: hypothetical protein OS130_00825 [Thermodesulfobacteriota bacterium]|jgi:uncharacterized protein YfaS (alpha-2-macroglobulin family)|nr:MAG: hypothetical protein OS130_00825 [Thermodesulfobacteriota bacterium]
MLTKSLEYLSGLRKQIPASLFDARIHAYAVYLRTRNGIVTTNELDSLLNQLREKFPETWEKDLTSLYIASTFKLLKKDIEAEKLIGKIKLEAVQKPDYNYYYDSLTHNAQVLYILCKDFPERTRALKGSDLECILEPLIKETFNTTSSAYAILALDAYADTAAQTETTGLTIAELLPQGKRNQLSLPKSLFPATSFSPQAEAIQFSCDQDYPIFYQVTEAGFDKELPAEELKHNLEVQREYCDESGKPVTSVKLGDKLTVHLKVRAIENGSYENIAVVDLLPGGFEVELNPGIERTTRSEGLWGASRLQKIYHWEPQNVDIREDRVVVFGEVSPEVGEYVYTIRATNQGTYAIPPVFAESMYDRSMQAKGLGGKITVGGR